MGNDAAAAIQLLIDHGADVNEHWDPGNPWTTPIRCNMDEEKGASLSVAEVLVKNGAVLDVLEETTEAFLQAYSEDAAQAEVARHLISVGAVRYGAPISQ